MPVRVAAALALGSFVALWAAPADAQTVLWLRPPVIAEITWRGMLPTEGTGVAAGPSMVYPVPGLGGLLVAVLTHAAINQGAQSAERQREQEAANRVLEPYLPDLRAWPASALWEAALASGNSTPAKPDSGTAAPVVSIKAWHAQLETAGHPRVDVVPTFAISQDESVLVADVVIQRAARPGAVATEAVVRLVSSPRQAPDVRAYWLADGGRNLKDAAAKMLVHALQLGEQPVAEGAADAPVRTHRYMQGSVERSERAQLLAADCSRLLLRTLRGGLLSVPASPKHGQACDVTSPF